MDSRQINLKDAVGASKINFERAIKDLEEQIKEDTPVYLHAEMMVVFKELYKEMYSKEHN